ncbi:hypothetical protein STRDD11_01038 [Streptococcus sp. DD11]|nr:hypothetical protein STRDD11_01038 [Streptococcus sp. DD11]
MFLDRNHQAISKRILAENLGEAETDAHDGFALTHRGMNLLEDTV